jgi:hypothetical protein
MLVDDATSSALDALAGMLEPPPVAARAQSLLRTAMQTDGICVCFKCAAPVLTQRYVAQHAAPVARAKFTADFRRNGSRRQETRPKYPQNRGENQRKRWV